MQQDITTEYTWRSNGYDLAEFQVRVTFEYVKGEPETRDHPGTGSSLDIEGVDIVASKWNRKTSKHSYHFVKAPDWLYDDIIEDRRFNEDLLDEAES